MDAIEWLIDNGLAANQGDVAVKAGLGPNLISRIKNGHVKAVSDDAIRVLCDKFNELNIDYLRGKSDCISRYELAEKKADTAIKEAQRLLDANPPNEPRQHSSMDDSLLYEKAIKKIYDKVSGQFIDVLKAQVDDQRHTIQLLEQEIDEKNKTIASLQSHIRDLESYIKSHATGNPLENYPFPVGVADDSTTQMIAKK